jgi:hypothetical protein
VPTVLLQPFVQEQSARLRPRRTLSPAADRSSPHPAARLSHRYGHRRRHRFCLGRRNAHQTVSIDATDTELVGSLAPIRGYPRNFHHGLSMDLGEHAERIQGFRSNGRMLVFDASVRELAAITDDELAGDVQVAIAHMLEAWVTWRADPAFPRDPLNRDREALVDNVAVAVRDLPDDDDLAVLVKIGTRLLNPAWACGRASNRWSGRSSGCGRRRSTGPGWFTRLGRL